MSAYLNQTAVYRRKTGTDARGQPVYSAAEIVPCRRRSDTRLVLIAEGQAVKSETIYYLAVTARYGDELDGRLITAVSEWVSIDGEPWGCKAVT